MEKDVKPDIMLMSGWNKPISKVEIMKPISISESKPVIVEPTMRGESYAQSLQAERDWYTSRS